MTSQNVEEKSRALIERLTSRNSNVLPHINSSTNQVINKDQVAQSKTLQDLINYMGKYSADELKAYADEKKIPLTYSERRSKLKTIIEIFKYFKIKISTYRDGTPIWNEQISRTDRNLFLNLLESLNKFLSNQISQTTLKHSNSNESKNTTDNSGVKDEAPRVSRGKQEVTDDDDDDGDDDDDDDGGYDSDDEGDNSDDYYKFKIKARKYKTVKDTNITLSNYPIDDYSQSQIQIHLPRYLYELINAIPLENRYPIVISLILRFLIDNTDPNKPVYRYTSRTNITTTVTISSPDELNIVNINNSIEHIINSYLEEYNVQLRPDILGFDIRILSEIKMMEVIKKLKAFGSAYNPKIHRESAASTCNDPVCIYETAYMIFIMWRPIDAETGVKSRDLRSWTNNRHREKEINELLEKEGPVISDYVRKGKFVCALSELCSKYKKSLRIFCDELKCIINIKENGLWSVIDIDEDNPPSDTIEGEFDAKYYQSDQHMVPYIYKRANSEAAKEAAKKYLAPYVLKHVDMKQKLEDDEEIIKTLAGGLSTFRGVGGEITNFILCTLDIETYFEDIEYDKNGNVVRSNLIPYLLCYKIGDSEIMYIYGLDCMNKFAKIVLDMIHPTCKSKARPKNAIHKYRFVAHNGSGFDYRYLLTEFYKLKKKPRVTWRGTQTPFIKIGNVEFIDSLLLIKGTLRDIAASFKCSSGKGLFPHKFSKLENLNYRGKIPEIEYWNSRTEYDEFVSDHDTNNYIWDFKSIAIEYCKQDVMVLYEIMKKYYEASVGEINGFKYDTRNAITASGAALLMYKQTMSREYEITAPPKYVREAAREAYYGGLTGNCKSYVNRENHYRGYKHGINYYHIRGMQGARKYINYADINSSYPSCCTGIIPTNFKRKYQLCISLNSKSNISFIKDHHLYNVKVLYQPISKHHIPNLPVRYKDKLYQPLDQTENGNWRWGIEIRRAISEIGEGYIKISSCMEFDGAPIFENFINTVFQRRQEAKNKMCDPNIDEIKRAAYKCLSENLKITLNSFYGKWGQRIFRTNDLVNGHQLNALIKRNYTNDFRWLPFDDDLYWISYNDRIYQNKNVGNLVHFSSYIAACARTKLCEMFEKVGYENVIYFDTDSVIYLSDYSLESDPRLINMVDNVKLGYWKNEHGKDSDKPSLDGSINWIITLGPKMYCYGYTDKKGNEQIVNKLKGIPTELLKHEHFIKLLNPNENHKYEIPIMWKRELFSVVHNYNNSRTVTSQLSKRNFIDYLNSYPINQVPK